MEGEKKYGKPPCRFKADISEQEYNSLLMNFINQGDWSQAIYLYFDTDYNQEEAKLFLQGLRFRVRLKYGNYSLELKSRVHNERWEMSQPISSEEFKLIFQHSFPEGEIKSKLSKLRLFASLKWIGTANTVRKKIHFRDGVLVLDQTTCCNNAQTHYQIEFRSDLVSLPHKIKSIEEDLNVLMRPSISKGKEIFVH